MASPVGSANFGAEPAAARGSNASRRRPASLPWLALVFNCAQPTGWALAPELGAESWGKLGDITCLAPVFCRNETTSVFRLAASHGRRALFAA